MRHKLELENLYRVVPESMRHYFRMAVKDTFKGDDTPVSYRYEAGFFEFEGKEYRHELEILYMYFDHYGQLEEDYVVIYG